MTLTACGGDTPAAAGELPPAEARAGVAEATPAFPRTVLETGTEYQPIKVVQLAELENPWALAFLPDGGYLVTERGGRLLRVDDEGGLTAISGVPEVAVRNQGGLLDVVLHPDFENNSWVYLTYSLGDRSETTTALARGRLDGSALLDVEVLFEQDRRSEPGRHYGSRLAWMEDGTLLMSIGDRGSEPPRAQDPMDHAGTLLRLTEDGGVPADNPFADGRNALPEIYSTGHRNIQGLVVLPGSGAIWATEHGPRGGDELNLVRPGENYGWPRAGKGRDYRTEEMYGEARSVEGLVDPVYEFLPTLAPSGLAVVSSDRFPRWQGNLLAGGLRPERIARLVIENDDVVHEESLLLQAIGRIRDVREGPDGHIYVLTDEGEGGLYRIEPN
ncbi:MAG: PQQ-dependent sugar dehydrogenase [Gammaproteobacteria bacterium]|nr:PQQ-dependent sugar dehydrogenase [Gammaproteobacteria bacterium]